MSCPFRMWYHAGVRAFATKRPPPNANGDTQLGYSHARDNATAHGLTHVRIDELRVGDTVIAVFSRQLRKRTIASITPTAGRGRRTLRFEDGRAASPRGRSAYVLRVPRVQPKLSKKRRGGPFDWMMTP